MISLNFKTAIIAFCTTPRVKESEWDKLWDDNWNCENCRLKDTIGQEECLRCQQLEPRRDDVD